MSAEDFDSAFSIDSEKDDSGIIKMKRGYSWELREEKNRARSKRNKKKKKGIYNE